MACCPAMTRRPMGMPYIGLYNTSRIIGPILFYIINCVTVFKKNAVTREYSRFQNRPMHAPSRIYDTKPTSERNLFILM